MATLNSEVRQKRFFFPADAEAVQRIISTHALKRMLMNAIEFGDIQRVRSVVARLQESELAQWALDQPVNAALETPLHVAVRKANFMVAKVLLDSGASPLRRNLRGDTPSQCFMLPRWSRASQLSRSTATQAGESVPEGRYRDRVGA